MGFTISSDQLIWFCTLVAGLWGLWKIIKKVQKTESGFERCCRKA